MHFEACKKRNIVSLKFKVRSLSNVNLHLWATMSSIRNALGSHTFIHSFTVLFEIEMGELQTLDWNNSYIQIFMTWADKLKLFNNRAISQNIIGLDDSLLWW